MENKKHLPLRITNAILLAASLVLCVVAMIKNSTDTSAFGNNPMTTICDVLNILMLAFGLVYLLMNYSKNAAIIYKFYFAVLYVGTFVQAILLPSAPYFNSTYLLALNLIALSAIAVLSIASDLGRNNSLILVSLFILCRVALFVIFISNTSIDGSAVIGVISSGVSNLLISLTTGYMVLGKYTDKKDRGAN